ncbi:hypothetical protein QR680_017684 [Steinernema hermaphroditum]|uniref:G-protein coupled receptors family 1 profile domain-containing protein n=1 Tax=Steinernema hermaphroditum TaxID=289476 RepID=A0AA39HHV4_9BILA|nr:hypothetical protein QR680_017684 [Steinernema hermaphroditum]
MNCSAVVLQPIFDGTTFLMLISNCVLFVFAASGNVTMFLILNRNMRGKKRNSRILFLLYHMTVADLIVTFEYLPKEIVHTYTVGWYAGDLLCKLCKFFDIFGIYLSANILICMCFDRLFAVTCPLSALKGLERTKLMVITAWFVAILLSSPQLFIWVTASHPCDKSFTQCVSKDFIRAWDPRITLTYTFLTAVETYFVPLAVIIICYSFIFYRLRTTVKLHIDVQKFHQKVQVPAPMTSRSSQNLGNFTKPRASAVHLDNLMRAKSKTLKMTFCLVIFFIVCWTPYYTAVMLYFFRIDFNTGRIEGKAPIPKIVTRFLYLFATFNATFNGYVYGYFSFDLWKEICALFRSDSLKRKRTKNSRSPAERNRNVAVHSDIEKSNIFAQSAAY